MACPKCGEKHPNSMVRCGKFRAYICEKHCNEGCEYFSGFETTHVHCFFRDKQIEKRKREAAERSMQASRDENK